MATRRNIREAFQEHVALALDGLVLAKNIRMEEPETSEDLPAVVYRYDFRKIPMNGGSGAPSSLERDSNGNVTHETYQTVHEGSFGTIIVGDNEQQREDIYETLRSYFEKFEHPAWDSSTIQEDVDTVRVLDSNPSDDTDASPSQRGDRLVIRLTFTRNHVKEVDHVDQVDRTTS